MVGCIIRPAQDVPAIARRGGACFMSTVPPTTSPFANAGSCVATAASEISKLEAIRSQGVANGVEELEMINQQQARALERELACVAAVHSAETGIVDSHRLMLALRGDFEDQAV